MCRIKLIDRYDQPIHAKPTHYRGLLTANSRLLDESAIGMTIFQSNLKIMGSVKIDSEDSTSIKEFEDGNSIQVRVMVSEKEKPEYEKGKSVKVIHEGREMTGKIVSEPILIDRKREDGKITLSLILEKNTPGR